MSVYKHYVDLDLTQNELQNPRFHILTTTPPTPVDGQFWYKASAGARRIGFWDSEAAAAIYVPRTDYAETITGLWTFSRSTSAPFAVLSGSAKVTYLDSDFLDGWHGDQTNNADTVAVRYTGGRVRVSDPSEDADAVSYGFLKTYISGIRDPKEACRIATTANLSATRASNTLTASANGSINSSGIDGVTDIALNDRVLVKDQTTQEDNGIYYVSDLGSAGTPWVMIRTTDADSSAEVTNGMTTVITEGDDNAATQWLLITPDPITLNTTDLEFILIGSSTPVTAGNGICLSGTEINAITCDAYTYPAVVYSATASTLAFVTINSSATNKFLRQVSSGNPSFESLTGADFVNGIDGTSGYIPVFTSQYKIEESTIYKNASNYGIDGGLHIGTLSGTAGDNNLRVDGAVGIGVAPSSQIGIYGSLTQANNSSAGIAYSLIATASSSSSYWPSVLSISATGCYCETGITNSGFIAGIYNDARINNASHLGTLAGLYGEYITHGIGSSGAGTVTSSFGIRITGSRAAGTVGTLWGIYESGDDKNYFASKTGIGFDSPEAKLAINGGVHVGGTTDPSDNNLLVDGCILRGTSASGTYYLDLQEAGEIQGRIKATAAGAAYFSLDSSAGTSSAYLIAKGGSNKWACGSYGWDVVGRIGFYDIANSKEAISIYAGANPYLAIPNGGLRVGGTADPGDNNCYVDGTATANRYRNVLTSSSGDYLIDFLSSSVASGLIARIGISSVTDGLTIYQDASSNSWLTWAGTFLSVSAAKIGIGQTPTASTAQICTSGGVHIGGTTDPTAGNLRLAGLTASMLVQTDASKTLVSSNNLPSTTTINSFAIARKYSTTIGGATSNAVTHNFGTRVVNVEVYRTGTPYDKIGCSIEHTDDNTVTVGFNVAPSAGEYTVVVIG